MRWPVAVFLVVHGLAHLPGFLVPWRLMSPPRTGYKTTVLDGTANIGPTGIRVLGLLWLLAGFGFVAAGIATARGSPVWPRLTFSVAVLSLVLSIVSWPESRIGVALNLLVLGYLWIGGRSGWLSVRESWPAK